MWQLIIEGPDPRQRSKLRLEGGGRYVVGRDESCDVPVPWEGFLSREHFELRPRAESVAVTICQRAKNPVYFDGSPRTEIDLVAGDRLVVGETSFLLRELQPLSPVADAPVHEVVFSNAELERVQFADADRRLEALARLPAVIGLGLDPEEQGAHLAALILAGIVHAEATAVVALRRDDDVEVVAWERRHEAEGSFRPSVSLVRDALHEGKTVLHVWEKAAQQTSSYTISAEFDWAFCTPVTRSNEGRWGIYVAGKLDQRWTDAEPVRRNLQSDIRFTQLIGEVVSSAQRMNRMEGQLSVLRQFLSPPLLAALEQTGRNGELNVDLLQPRVCNVTVIFCDLRGFSHRAEEEAGDLQGLLSRVSGALEVMTKAILDHGGVTGDFLGDAVLGFWGWPFPSEDAPLRACRAALAIRRQFTRIQSTARHPLADFRVGIGVAYGRAVAGKIGTGGRVNVTVFGPVVNLASRLEGMTKRLRVPVLVDEATADLAREGLTAKEGRVRKLASVLPYGLERPLVVSELVPPVSEFPDLNDEHLSVFEQGVGFFEAGNWSDAYRCFHSIPSSDQAQDFFLALLAQHNRSAPPGWKGIVELPGK